MSDFRITASGALEVMQAGTWTHVPSRAAKEIEALRAEVDRQHDRILETSKLSYDWMRKHDELLGFIQARPAVLKELIQHRAGASAQTQAEEGK